MSSRTLEPETKLARNTPRPQSAIKNRKRGGHLRRWLIILFLLALLIILSPFVIVQLINDSNQSRIFTSAQAIPSRPVAIVFGAGLNRDGSPSPMLADRLNSAVALYQAGKAQRLLLTGDNTTSREVTAMRNYALRQGVPANAIDGDAAGLRTYDSCYRAKRNFGITSAILVTQGYHLPRALYLCNALGIESVGFKAGRDDYPGQEHYNEREFAATFMSWVDINISKPKPEIEDQK